MNGPGLILILSSSQPDAMEKTVPELPNFITLLYHRFQDTAWAQFLHQWESVIFAILVAICISVVATIGASKKALIPNGLQNFLELAIDHFRHLILGVLGKDGEKYIPFLGTLFVYILSMNLFGLIPFMKSPSSNLNITVALSLCVFCLVQFLNIKHMGILGFIYHLAGSPKDTLGWLLAPFLFILELISQISRPVTLALRLFGNILGEDILIGAFALMGIVLIAQFNSPIGIPLQIPFMFFVLLASTMQALVFTLLSTVYILLSTSHSEDKH